jgi:hypothetical protein
MEWNTEFQQENLKRRELGGGGDINKILREIDYEGVG